MKATRLLALMTAMGLMGCGTAPPMVGASRIEVLRLWGAPTAQHALPEGGLRLEYASGPYGRTTWMIDVDAGGRVTQASQVLSEAHFLQVMSLTGLNRGEVLRRLGTPGERRGIGWQGSQVWSWRYPTNDCLWFELTLAADGLVSGGGYAIDPSCDAPSDRE